MKPYMKHISLIACIAIIAAMAACKKENTQKIQTDIRDSLVGNYNCTKHYGTWTLNPYPGVTTDSVIGPVVLTISKLSTYDSSLVIMAMSSLLPAELLCKLIT